MLNSRKLFRAFALPGLLALAGVSGFAQTCTLFTTNFALRPEGLTELIGDKTVTCTTALPANFSILVQLPNGVNFNTQFNPSVAATGGTLGTISTTYAPAGLPNTVSISAVGNTALTGFTITGLRINANAAASAGIVSIPALMIISSGATIINLDNNPSLVATILPKSLSFTVVGGNNPNTTPTPGAAALATCISNNVVTGFFRFSESFTAVLRRASQEGPNATQGTRLRVVLSGIPANVAVFVPTGSFTTGNNILTALSGVGSAVSGVPTGSYTGFTGAGATPGGDPVYTGGYGQASGEILFGVETLGASSPTSDSTSTVDVLHIPFVVRYTGGPSVGVGTALARGGLGTVGGTGIVRFADVTDQANAFSTVLCATSLLWPYVTTDGGFDTGIAIANTTADPSQFGTPNQSGRCTITPYGRYASGATVPAAGTTPVIPAGTVYATALQDSPLFPGGMGRGFTGYLIAQCEFQLAHGYGFVSTYGLVGANAVAQGYLALVLPQNNGTRTPNVGVATIEQLNN
jgi:hypothetical protein